MVASECCSRNFDLLLKSHSLPYFRPRGKAERPLWVTVPSSLSKTTDLPLHPTTFADNPLSTSTQNEQKHDHIGMQNRLRCHTFEKTCPDDCVAMNSASTNGSASAEPCSVEHELRIIARGNSFEKRNSYQFTNPESAAGAQFLRFAWKSQWNAQVFKKLARKTLSTEICVLVSSGCNSQIFAMGHVFFLFISAVCEKCSVHITPFVAIFRKIKCFSTWFCLLFPRRSAEWRNTTTEPSSISLIYMWRWGLLILRHGPGVGMDEPWTNPCLAEPPSRVGLSPRNTKGCLACAQIHVLGFSPVEPWRHCLCSAIRKWLVVLLSRCRKTSFT